MRPTKFDILAKDLMEYIADAGLKPGAQMLSQHDIARKYNVSRSCVNKALDVLYDRGIIEKQPGRGNFLANPDKKERKLKTLAYIFEESMRLTPHEDDDYGLQVLWGIEDACRKNGINLVLRAYSEKDIPTLDLIINSLDLDAVLLRQTTPTEAIIKIGKLGIPGVCIDRPSPSPDLGAVFVNFYDTYLQMVGKALSEGAKSVGILYARNEYYGLEIESVLYRLKLLYPEADIRGYDFAVSNDDYDCDQDLYLVPKCFEEKIFAGKGVPEVLFCQTDYWARFGLKLLKEHGFKVPQDVKLIGGLGLKLGKALSPKITTLDVDPFCFGGKAVNMLNNMVFKDMPPAADRLPMIYVERESFSFKK
jgi:DNA-binding LacI/PurR family transcriptional regulator